MCADGITSFLISPTRTALLCYSLFCGLALKVSLVEQIQSDVVSEDVVTELPPVLPLAGLGLLELLCGVLVLRGEVLERWVLGGRSGVLGDGVGKTLNGGDGGVVEAAIELVEGVVIVGKKAHVSLEKACGRGRRLETGYRVTRRQ